jgi:hypothetical protein
VILSRACTFSIHATCEALEAPESLETIAMKTRLGWLML